MKLKNNKIINIGDILIINNSLYGEHEVIVDKIIDNEVKCLWKLGEVKMYCNFKIKYDFIDMGEGI